MRGSCSQETSCRVEGRNDRARANDGQPTAGRQGNCLGIPQFAGVSAPYELARAVEPQVDQQFGVVGRHKGGAAGICRASVEDPTSVMLPSAAITAAPTRSKRSDVEVNVRVQTDLPLPSNFSTATRGGFVEGGPKKCRRVTNTPPRGSAAIALGPPLISPSGVVSPRAHRATPSSPITATNPGADEPPTVVDPNTAGPLPARTTPPAGKATDRNPVQSIHGKRVRDSLTAGVP